MIAYRSDDVLVWEGDCIELMRSLPDACMDSVVTDPPYALEFMGKGWDKFTPLEFEAWCALWAAECFRLLKPGAHLLAFGGTRTFHRLAAGIEDAGFEIRDSIAWLYGSGFPKSLDVSKAIDKAAGAERPVVSEAKPVKRMIPGADRNATGSWVKDNGRTFTPTETAPGSEDSARWAGWGTALKPAFEPIVVARKPLVGTVAANVLAHGTGALNIDASRIAGDVPSVPRGLFSGSNNNMAMAGRNGTMSEPNVAGRWPANVVLDEDQAVALDEQSGVTRDGHTIVGGGFREQYVNGETSRERTGPAGYGGSGGASRFFYVAKASKRERPKHDDGSAHPTVKPLALMQWLVRLVTPPGGQVLDPFAGSGTTVEACLREGLRCMAMERETDYLPLILHRIDRHLKEPT